MKRYVFYIIAALLTFAIGVSGASLFDSLTAAWLDRVEHFICASLTLASSVVCFIQAFHHPRGLRRSVSYNLVMLSLSAALFIVGFVLFFGILVISFS
jgi:uncharacterized membrane protein YgdD (TMEM256/DUF423 family)